ncbi:antibiotic biosynthesis monooxygenase [Nocardia sp. KC 131]|uniref:antibiotic biosynthesis monooxygenase n=1 Tax=Nocardia arseniciresistens TaxID=3392119 RepID=UPI00398EDCC5
MGGEVAEPVSTRISRTVPAEKVNQFEALLHEMNTAARGFEGHLGVDVLRPDGGGVYEVIFRYRGYAEHAAWMGSERRTLIAARIDELLDDGTTATVRSVDGWEGWFVNPGYAPPAPPQRWKMALITFGVLYPVVLGLTVGLRPLTSGWPLPLGMALTMSVTIPIMTWIVMPALTARLGDWLRR